MHPTDSVNGWRESIRQDFFPLDLQVIRPDRFQAESATKVRAGSHMARIRASEHVARMTDAACQRLAQPCIKVLWLHQGEAAYRQGSRKVALAPGQWLLYEASRPYSLEMSDSAHFTVLFSHVSPNDAWLQRGLPGKLGPQPIEEAARLALDMISSALNQDLHLQSRTQMAFNLGLRALLDAALQDETPGLARQGGRRHLLEEAKACLLAHLTDSRLSSDQLAERLGVSRRALYKAFQADKETPQSFQFTQRLLRCREMLLGEHGAHLNLTHLAYEYGFADAAHFSRAYKRQFGESPSQAQRQARNTHA